MKAEAPIIREAGRFNLRKLFATVAILGAVIFTHEAVIRAGAQGELVDCKTNLKNIGTAMEMYSTDNSGKYPNDPALLVPEYLKALPQCPSATVNTYEFEVGEQATGNTNKFKDYYFIYCRGENHAEVNVPANLPNYNGLSGCLCREHG